MNLIWVSVQCWRKVSGSKKYVTEEGSLFLLSFLFVGYASDSAHLFPCSFPTNIQLRRWSKFLPSVGTSGSAALGVSAWITSWSLWSDPRIHNLTQKQKWHQMSQDLATKTTSDALSLRHCGFTWTFDSSNHVLWIHFNPEEHTYEKVFEQLWWMFYLFRGIFSKASALMTNI